MAFADIDGIRTQYEVTGDGPPLLMLAPAGFDSSISRWRLNGVWKEMQPLDTLRKDFTTIAYDRREAGESGGRIEPLTWAAYARHAVALLDHLKIDRAFVIGGCMGVSVALAIGARYPQRVRGLLLHWPVGGYRWMVKARSNFDRHLDYLKAHGFAGVAERAKQSGLFWNDPEAGPWSAPIKHDAVFAARYMAEDVEAYRALIVQSRDNLFSDTMPSGASGEELLAMQLPAFIMSGDDASHSASSAQVLRELLPNAQLSLLMPPAQNAASVAAWIRECKVQIQ
jgi:pimeloyl-ACP methyl ester carboxylesterase